jgi:hypothetical protein
LLRWFESTSSHQSNRMNFTFMRFWFLLTEPRLLMTKITHINPKAANVN